VKTIVLHPNPSLSAPCETVEKFDSKLIDLLEEMSAEMYRTGGIGIAANQIGESKRVFILHPIVFSEVEDVSALAKMVSAEYVEFVNPEIIKVSEEKEMKAEGCLSIPHVHSYVPRHKSVTIEAQTRQGVNFTIADTTGLLAQAVQHEVDHLNGKLYIDHLNKVERAQVLKASKLLQKIKD
jgi:peptide deformylase